MMKRPTIYKSYLVRFCLLEDETQTLAHIRLEDVTEHNEVHHFVDVEGMVDFLLEKLKLPVVTEAQ